LVKAHCVIKKEEQQQHAQTQKKSHKCPDAGKQGYAHPSTAFLKMTQSNDPSSPKNADASQQEAQTSGPVDQFLNATGLNCPLPVLRARKTLQAMKPGHILQVAATDPVAALDLPHFCNETGHVFLDARSDETDKAITYFRIQRAALS